MEPSTITREQALERVADGMALALERLNRSFSLLLERKPVRDVAETEAEVTLALYQWRTFLKTFGLRTVTSHSGAALDDI